MARCVHGGAIRAIGSHLCASHVGGSTNRSRAHIPDRSEPGHRKRACVSHACDRHVLSTITETAIGLASNWACAGRPNIAERLCIVRPLFVPLQPRRSLVAVRIRRNTAYQSPDSGLPDVQGHSTGPVARDHSAARPRSDFEPASRAIQTRRAELSGDRIPCRSHDRRRFSTRA